MKESGFSIDIVIAAAIISVALHAGLMFWARPQVMTHSPAVAKAARRGPMHVAKAEPRPEPVRFETVEDVAAEKAAPEAEGAVAALPAAEAAAPQEAERIAVPQPDMPKEVLVREVPAADRKLPETAEGEAFVAPVLPQKMEMESPALAPDAAAPAPTVANAALPARRRRSTTPCAGRT